MQNHCRSLRLELTKLNRAVLCSVGSFDQVCGLMMVLGWVYGCRMTVFSVLGFGGL